ncbi:MAG: tRNA (guanine(46)-N(7))-methyltransferase TrmB [Pseudomonadota bacterium]
MNDTPAVPPDGAPDERRNFYGRRMGKTLKPAQRRYLEEDLPRLSLGDVTSGLDPSALFAADRVWLEVGFGGGEHIVHQAKSNPDVALIGAEPYVNGIAMCLGKIRRAGVTNIRIHPGDARDLMDALPTGAIAKAFLLYPDPWPKARHHRRRFVTPDHLGPLHRVLAPGAEFRIATDIEDYVRQALEEVPPAGFIRADHPTDQPWDDWLSTRYEQKALREGRAPNYLTFHRAL